MKLHYAQISEQGAPLICVHGLFGSLDNLGVINKLLAEHFQVWALDLPNHGRSPHIDVMTHRITAESIIEFMDGQRIERASLFGHSLGGKAVMQLALDHPERVEKVVVGDIAPVKSRASHDGIFKAMFSIDLDAIQSRSDADRALANSIDEPVLRSFLLKNLRRNEDGKFQWRINLNGLFEQYHHV